MCEQFTLTLEKIKHQRKHSKSLGWATLDFEISHYRNPEEALLSIRLQLAEQCNITFPAFDTAFARYFSFTRKGHNIHDVHPALFSQANDVLQDIESVAGALIEEIPGFGLIVKYSKKLKTKTQEWWRRRGKEVLKDLDSLEQHKLLKALPKYLGADLYDWLFDKKETEKRRLVILMDTYEALWRNQPTKTGSESLRVDSWIRELVENTPGILFVILGRDELNWEKEWKPYIDPHLLDSLSPQDANRFLQKVPIKEVDIRDVIVESSAGVPFYLDIQVDLYEELRHKKVDLKASQFGGQEDEILARFIDHLDDQTRLALKVVSHASFIDEHLALILAEKFLGGSANIPFKKLTNYSFWRQENNIWSMHTLLREYLQDQQSKDQPEAYKQIHEFLFEYYDNQLDSIEQVVDINEKLKLALLEASYHQQQIDLEQFPNWANIRGQIFHEAYAWEQVEPLYQLSLIIGEKSLGEDHPLVANSLNNLAELYKSQGEYAKAEPLYQRSLIINKKSLGEDHPSVANSLNNLAELYTSQGEYAKAEPMYQRSLIINKKSLGEDHPLVATTLNNLGGLYYNQGEYAKAESMYQRSLRINEQSLGEDHPSVAKALNNLAGLYNNQRRYAKAESMYQRSLIIYEKSLGEDHPDVAITLNNLALLYKSQGEYAKAEPLYQRSLRNYEKYLGEDHPLVATTLNNLGGLYYNQGEYAKAESLYQRSLRINEQSLGEDHPSVANTLNNLAELYRSQGEYVKAEPLYQHSLIICEKSLGENLLLVATTLNNLAELYRSQGEYAKAEPLYQRSLITGGKSLGEDHPLVGTTLSNLALLYKTQGEYAKAEPLYQLCLRINEKPLGENHPLVATTLNNLALLYDTQGEYAKAEPFYLRAINILEKAFPDGHPNIDVLKDSYSEMKKISDDN